jgi:hypothetical protein
MINFDEISGCFNTSSSSSSSSLVENSQSNKTYSDELFLELFQDESEPSISSTPSEIGDDFAITLPPRRKRKSTKRRSNNPAFHPEIRIFRRDIRRKYAFMFNNVVNTHDSLLLSQFLKEFAVPHFEAHEEVPEDLNLKLYRMKVIQGQDQFVKILGMNFTMMPDGIFRLSDVKVCQTLNASGSRIVLHASMLGTMLYEVANSNSHHRTLTNGEETKESPYYAKDLQTSPTLQLVHKPYQYGVETLLTMQLDSNHRIISFVLTVQNAEEISIE